VELVYQLVTKVLNARTFYIALYDQAQQEMYFPVRIEEGDRRPPATVPFEPDLGLTGHVIATRRPLLLNSAVEFETLSIRRSPIKILAPIESVLAVPMIARERVLGVVSVQSTARQAYTHDDLDTLSTLAQQAAIAIDSYLQGRDMPPCEEIERYLKDRSRHMVTWEEINPNYFNLAQRIEPRGLAISERVQSFDEVYSGFSEAQALQEAQRCFSCGTCPSCDNCLVFCPDAAISRVAEGRYKINYDFCKGCGICVSECPRNAISIKVLK